VSDRERDEAQLTNAAVDSDDEGPTLGNRLVADDLADLGFTASDQPVWRLCSVNALVSEIGRRKRGKRTKPGPPELGDRVQRQFTVATPDPLWLTDITEHWTTAGIQASEGKLYCCAIKDVFSNRIVGDFFADRITADLAVAAQQMTIQRRRSAGTIVHSDRGSQFRSRAFVLELHRDGLVSLMGRVGAAGGNAARASPGDSDLNREDLSPETYLARVGPVDAR